MARTGRNVSPVSRSRRHDGPMEDAGATGSNGEQKKAWRARIARRPRRSNVDSGDHCGAIAPFLRERVPAGRRVVVYMALPGEIDLSELVEQHPMAGERFAVTRTPPKGRVLSLHPITAPMERHRFGYLQPVGGSPEVRDESVGAVLVPGLAFDRQGSRLGHGQGYYDRLLARLPSDVLRLGVTGDVIVERLPAEPHDIPMTHLVTSTAVHSVPSSSLPITVGDVDLGP